MTKYVVGVTWKEIVEHYGETYYEQGDALALGLSK